MHGSTEKQEEPVRAALKVQGSTHPLHILVLCPRVALAHLPDMDAQVASVQHELLDPMRLVAFISSATHANDASCHFMASPHSFTLRAWSRRCYRCKLILDIIERNGKSDGQRPKSLTLFINHARRLDSP
jgi:hypothetical protein